jgi:hypothetical protein
MLSSRSAMKNRSLLPSKRFRVENGCECIPYDEIVSVYIPSRDLKIQRFLVLVNGTYKICVRDQLELPLQRGPNVDHHGLSRVAQLPP